MTIIRDLPNDVYHADPEHTSNSRLRDFIERGARFYYDKHVARTIAREDSEHFRFGTAFEILKQCGGDAFDKAVLIKHAGVRDGRTKEGKAFLAAAESSGRIVIDQADYDAMLAMLDSLDECADGVTLTQDAEQQVTLRGTLHGLRIQTRPDWCHLSEYGSYTVDLKTTKNLNDLLVDGNVCGASLTRLGYHTQAAIARALLAENGYPGATAYLWVVEKQPSHRSVLIDLDALLGRGDQELKQHAPPLAHCINTNTWPRAHKGIVRLQRPRWMADEATAP